MSFWLFFAPVAWAQSPLTEGVNKIDFTSLKPLGFFVEDSIQIGLSVYYSLSFQHPSEMEVLFPDSTYIFAPFELVGRRFYETRTQTNSSLDSVVYELTTYQIDPVQKLRLPVYVLEKDTLILYTQEDSLFFQDLVKEDPNKVLLKESTNPESIPQQFNYPYLIAGLVILIILVFVIWGILGNQIQRTLRLYRSSTKHARFLRDFERLVNRIIATQQGADMEKALALWKKHLAYLEEKPISTYTSKEIAGLFPDSALVNHLKSIDRAIYGKVFSEEIGKSLQFLKNFSVIRFDKQQDKIRNHG